MEQGYSKLAKMMGKVGKKQERMTQNIRSMESQIQAMSVTMAEQGQSLQFVHGEVSDLKDHNRH